MTDVEAAAELHVSVETARKWYAEFGREPKWKTRLRAAGAVGEFLLELLDLL